MCGTPFDEKTRTQGIVRIYEANSAHKYVGGIQITINKCVHHLAIKRIKTGLGSKTVVTVGPFVSIKRFKRLESVFNLSNSTKITTPLNPFSVKKRKFVKKRKSEIILTPILGKNGREIITVKVIRKEDKGNDEENDEANKLVQNKWLHD